ncbi:MAG: carboxypeptidase regulatory-like domain-containing protein [Candidatus Bathyarchaeia archaeon]
MKHRKVVVTGLMMLLVVALPSLAVMTSGVQMTSVVGRVVDEYGRGLSEVKVEAYTSSGFLYETAQTDSDGYFSVYHLPMDVFTFNFSKTGYVDKIILVKTDGRTRVDLEEVVLKKALNLISYFLSLLANPGDKLQLPFTVSNVGKERETIEFSVSKPEGWSTKIISQLGEVTKISLEPGANLSLQLEVKIPITSTGNNTLSLTTIGKTNSTLNFTIFIKPTEESVLFCQFPKKTFAPGDTARFQVRVKNPFRDKVSFEFAIDGIPLNWRTFIKDMGGEILGGIMLNSGEFADLILELQIPPEEREGEYNVVFKTSSSVKSEDLNLSVLVAPSIEEPRVEVSIEPKKVQSDTEHTLNVKLRNISAQEIHKISVKLDTTPHLILLTPTEEFFIDELREGGLVTLTVPVVVLPATTTTPSKVTAQITYEDSFSRKYVKNMDLSLVVVPKKVEPKVYVEISPEELQIGKENAATLKILNKGASPVRGLEVNLESSPPIKIFGSSRIYVDYMDSDDVGEDKVRAYVPATSTTDTATLTVLLSYLDPDVGSVTRDSFSFSILLRGFIELRLVDYAVVPKKPIPGQPFSITVTLTNTGTSAAYATYAFPVTRELPVETFGPKSVYIGNVEVNTPITFTLNLILQNTTLSDLSLPITITYMDNLRTLHDVTYDLHFEVAPKPTTQEVVGGSRFLDLGNILTFALSAAVLIAVAVLLFRRLRKRE